MTTMKMLNVVKADLKRAFTSLYFWAAIVVEIAVMFMLLYGMMYKTYNKDNPIDVCSIISQVSTGSGMEILTIYILPLFGFSMSIASDCDDKAMRFWTMRCGIERYLISKCIVSALSGVMILFISMSVFAMMISPFFEFCIPKPEYLMISSTSMQNAILQGANPVFIMMIFILVVSMGAATMTSCAMVFSVFIPNKFAVLVAPMSIKIVASLLTRSKMDSLGMFNPNQLVNNFYEIEGMSVSDVLFTRIFVCALIVTISTLITVFVGKRRLRDG